MQAKAKEFIHHEEVNRVVAATKNLQSTPRGNASTAHPRDTQREQGQRGNPKFSKQKYDHYTPLIASITEYTNKSLTRTSYLEPELYEEGPKMPRTRPCFVIIIKDTDTKHKIIMTSRMLLNKRSEKESSTNSLKSFVNPGTLAENGLKDRKLGILGTSGRPRK
ncbi:hypothetical protein PIB30_006964 [Stylosanthes scabra]|uniref:Uncharacterized protein n=1 Tax=Stylosanthes scabra TaxID=79078 RepID=A0ABU6Y4S5_9FABA|nr:hypothetical protein [Stylosanthes scabra]